METSISTQIYEKDREILREFMKRKGIKCQRDAVRIAIEFADAHGAFK